MKMKTVWHRLTLKTINKSYTNNYNELVTQVNQQQQCVREGYRQANATITIMYTIHKQQ